MQWSTPLLVRRGECHGGRKKLQACVLSTKVTIDEVYKGKGAVYMNEHKNDKKDGGCRNN